VIMNFSKFLSKIIFASVFFISSQLFAVTAQDIE
ncbi:uncharacterized protein METZ01_LOCUS481139, partial [marine metagenome]